MSVALGALLIVKVCDVVAVHQFALDHKPHLLTADGRPSMTR
ncbi:hypothetical protein ACPZ19_46265 [Amycolatopsis lurida]